MGKSLRLHDQLIDQAAFLVARDRRRPTQANLRRAASAAYYALFHYVAAEAAREFLGGTADRNMRAALARTVEHGALRSACGRFSSTAAPDNLPGALRNCLPSISVSLRSFARSIVALQNLRHRADYDMSHSLLKPEVVEAIDETREAMTAWLTVEGPERTVFLLATTTWRALAGRTSNA